MALCKISGSAAQLSLASSGAQSFTVLLAQMGATGNLNTLYV